MNKDSQREELESRLAELKEERETLNTKTGPREIVMDDEDRLRLENILLREKLSERERQDARDRLHARLVAKYRVNVATETVAMDPSKGIIVVSPRVEASEDEAPKV